MSSVPVWLDTDPAVGVPGRDVDDGLALLQALRSPELQPVGISTVFGNTTLPRAHPIAEELLREAGADAVPLHRGAAEAAELGTETEASRALAAALDREPLDVLALGPLTNVATVLSRRADLAPRVRRVVAVAGRRPGQVFTVGSGADPLPDFNVECDADAAAAVLDTEVPLTLAGFEVASQVWLRRAELERLAAGPPPARWLAGPAERWRQLWERRFGVEGFHPFDTLAVACLATPRLVATEPAQAAVVEVPGTELQVAPALAGGRPVRYATRPRAAFTEELMRRLLGGAPALAVDGT